jgi:hypothetical protein
VNSFETEEVPEEVGLLSELPLESLLKVKKALSSREELNGIYQ